MAVLTDSTFLDLVLVLIPVLYIVYRWYNSNNDYWDIRGVPCYKSGMLIKVLTNKQSQYEQTIEFYQTFANEPFGGFIQFRKPALVINDPELIHRIMVKDFSHFQDRALPKIKTDVLAESLFSLRGQTWRALRYKLTPTFSTGKLKGMFEQVANCGENMIEKIEELSKENIELNTEKFLYEFSLDVVASCAFGLQFKPNSPEFNEFKLYVSKIFNGPKLVLKMGFLMLFPKLAEKLSLSLFTKELGDYFLKLSMTTAKFRKENNIQRDDYFQLLLTLKEQEESGKDLGLTAVDASEEDAVINQMQYTEENGKPLSPNVKLMTDEVICANCFIFLLAGSSSASSTISLALFEISRHAVIQQKLQQEIDTVLAKHGGCWSYSAIRDMTYLDQVIQESQRLYPAMPLIMRECIQPYKVPGSKLVIEKGVVVTIPAYGLHMDPKYYPEPEKFEPERFEGNNFKPNPTYLPFGDGPRICIAMRFAVMEVKTAVARIVSQYTVKLGSKTQLPLKFVPNSAFPTPKGGIWLSFEKRTTK